MKADDTYCGIRLKAADKVFEGAYCKNLLKGLIRVDRVSYRRVLYTKRQGHSYICLIRSLIVVKSLGISGSYSLEFIKRV